MFDRHQPLMGFYRDNVALPSEQRTNMRDRRNTNRKRLKDGLAAEGHPKPFGCHTQGSYAMRTMVQDAQNDYDIDDGVYFDKEKLVGPNGGERSSTAIKQMVCEALQDDRFATPPEIHTNCVRVYYNEGYHVDVPAYRRSYDAWGNATFELASTKWKASDPLAVTKWFKGHNKDRSPDLLNDGQLCRIVKYMKMFGRSRPSWKGQMASGFMMSVLVIEVYNANAGREDECLRNTMQEIYYRLLGNLEISHPILPEKLTKSADDAKSRFLRDKLEWALKQLEVLDDWDCTEDEANAAWNTVFNTDYFVKGPDESLKSPPILKSSTDSPNRPVDPRGGGRYG